MTGSEDYVRRRVSAVGAMVVLLFGVLLARLWFLQVLAGAQFTAAAENNHVRIVSEEAPRGRILDRNGRVLVKNRTALAVGIRRDDFPKDPEEAARLKRRLARLLDIRVAQIDQRLADQRVSPYKAVVIAEDVPLDAIFTIRERPEDHPGIEALELPVRTYPFGTLAAHILGYVGEINEAELAERREQGYRLGDSIGRTGIERTYEQYLRGTASLEKLEVDARGRVLRSLGGQQAIPGNDVQLSIDAKVQRVAERALRDGISLARQRSFHLTGRRFRAPAGAVVVLGAKTGEVIAMASYPTFDPQRFVGGVSQEYYAQLNDPDRHFPLLNRAVQSTYPPGSTWKSFMAVAALTDGAASAGSRHPCLTEYRYGNTVFRNWQPRNERISLEQSLIESCDTPYYDLAADWYRREREAERAGRKVYEVMQDFARRFGFGSTTGIDLPEGQETAGRVPDRAYTQARFEQRCTASGAPKDKADVAGREFCPLRGLWLPGYSINMSIGQGDLTVTPLQLAVGYAALANRGEVLRPRLAMRVVDREGNEVTRIKRKVVRTIDVPRSVWNYVDTALRRTTERGTAQFPYRGWPVERIPMAGKTGSAEIGGKQPFSWFASYGPTTDPEYVAVAVVEEAGFGSQVAGPIVRRVMDTLFDRPPTPIVIGGAAD